MENVITVDQISQLEQNLTLWVNTYVLAPGMLVQAMVVFAALGLAFIVRRPLRSWLNQLVTLYGTRPKFEWLPEVSAQVSKLLLPMVWALLQWVSAVAATSADYPATLLHVTTSLLTAWIIIHILTSFVRNPLWSRFIASTVWMIAALNILDLLAPARTLLDSLDFSLGDLRVSVLNVIESVLLLVFLVWLASALARLIEQQLAQVKNLSPSAKVLIGQTAKIILIVSAVSIALTSTGINLAAFAFFGGAFGLGIGFGLQKIISNFVSGIILLVDKSVKPGDTIAVAGTFGWINHLGARYVSVITRDGTEHLIPNEELIINSVENWSYSNSLIRLHAAVSVSYACDLHKALELCAEAALETDRILAYPEPKCLLTGFGDSAIDLEIRMWIKDPQNGRGNVISDVLLNVWEKFQANDIEIPYPQRDLHIKSVDKSADSDFAGLANTGA